MPNLVGIGNSQVPTNAMLGGLAYQDSFDVEVISKIKKRVSDNAVDIFVYDTRKDSDGGAWRHRTQNTSWYNEGASETRGARKEFPAVVIIVAETTKITMYDGDDSNCPVWMVINKGTDTEPTMLWDGNNANTCTSVAAKNGTIMWTTYAGGSYGADFIGERWIYFYNAQSNSGFRHNGGGIVNRNKAVSSRTVVRQFNGYCLASSHRKVAMTVRPNASIDPVTGLPIPLIVLATDDGLEFIKDNVSCHLAGNTRDIVRIRGQHGGQNQNLLVDFDSKTHAAIFTSNYGSGTAMAYKLNVHKVPSASFDDSNTYSDFQEHSRRIQTMTNVTIPKLEGYGIVGLISAGGNGRYAVRTTATSSQPSALNILQEEPGKDWEQTNFPANSRIAYITSSHNSGWMHGNIRRAHLADTDTTSLTNTSLIANGDFSSSSTAAFTQVAGGTAAVVGGLLKLTDTGGVFCYASAPFTTVPGNQYFITVDIVDSSNTAPSNYIRCGNSHNGTQFHDTNYGTSYGTKTFYFTATETTTYLTLISGNGVGEIGHWDNVFAYQVDNDMSLTKKGLRPYGTVTRTPVATGAELVGYGGWSSSNYLLGEYVDADDDVGSGDYSVIAWAKTSTSHTGIIWSIRNPSSASAGWSQLWVNDDNIRFGQNAGGYTTSNTHYHDGNWHCYVGVKRNNKALLYFDGHLTNEVTMSQADPGINASSQYRVGNHYNGQHHFQGEIALVRYSKSAMGADIVEKIFEDEKLLFQENAKCTLYGTTDQINAIAYDNDKEILHAGTSAGRSDFNRLNRINNTTTAVTTVISASDGLIAEQ